MGCIGGALLSGAVLLLLLLDGVWSQTITWDDMRVDSRILTGMGSASHWASVSTPLRNLSGVIVVDQGGNGDSTTIQGAVDLVPYSNPSRVKILILPGTYREKVTLGSGKPYVSLIGRPNQASNTVITWSDKASDTYSSNGTQLGTYNTATMSVFSDYFCATEVTFENTVVAMPGDEGRQAVALRVASERAMLHRVRVVGSQDTLLDEFGCHLYNECFIQGSVDFVFGNARSLYRNTVLHSVANTSGAVAAQGRSSARDWSGFSFFNCTLSGSGRVLLGRAWGDYSTVLYSYCDIKDIVARQRWGDWGLPSRRLTAMFGEFHCRGEGAYYRGTDAWWNSSFTYQQVRPYLDISFIDGDKWLRL